ncbi:hypothetical protein Bca4012_060396 [Brassica carinata]
MVQCLPLLVEARSVPKILHGSPSTKHGYFKWFRRLTSTPLNFVGIQKENETVSTIKASIYSSEPDSPLQG